MAYTQEPGISPLLKTGRGIPTPFLQTNISSGSDLKAKAAAKAEKLRAADKSKLGTGETKTFTGTERDITPATTPEQVAAWKQAITKPGAGRNIRTESVTVKKEGFSDLKPAGLVSPKNQISGSEIKPTPNKAPVPTGMSWTRSDTNNKSGFGGGSEWGVANEGTIAAGEAKIASDTDPERIKRGAPFSTGEYNKFFSRPFTAQETKLYNADRIGPRSAEAVFSKDPKRQEYRQNWLNTAEERLDAGLKKKADAAAATKAKQTEAKTKFDAKAKAKAEARAVVAAKKPEELAAKKAALAAKKKAKAPTQMRKY